MNHGNQTNMDSTCYLYRCIATLHGHISIDTTPYEANRRTINMLFQKSKNERNRVL